MQESDKNIHRRRIKGKERHFNIDVMSLCIEISEEWSMLGCCNSTSSKFSG